MEEVARAVELFAREEEGAHAHFDDLLPGVPRSDWPDAVEEIQGLLRQIPAGLCLVVRLVDCADVPEVRELSDAAWHEQEPPAPFRALPTGPPLTWEGEVWRRSRLVDDELWCVISASRSREDAQAHELFAVRVYYFTLPAQTK